jgi:hypothetical protein
MHPMDSFIKDKRLNLNQWLNENPGVVISIEHDAEVCQLHISYPDGDSKTSFHNTLEDILVYLSNWIQPGDES